MEQVYWIQYRDRRLRAIYPKKWDQHYRKNYGKEVFNPCKCKKELLRLSESRIRGLANVSDERTCRSAKLSKHAQ